MRITRLTLKNIGPFDDATFEVPETPGSGEVVLFEGPNGCGKTTIDHSFGDGLVGAPTDSVRARMRAPSAALVEIAGVPAKVVLSIAATEVGGNHQFCSASPAHAEIAALTQTKVETQRWAAFAYRANHPTAVAQTRGPKTLQLDARKGALSFAADESQSASNLLGQELINLEYDRVRAETYAREQPANPEFSLAAVTNREAIERVAHGLSRVIDPDPKTHRIAGAVPAWPFRHGNSLTAVIEDVFATPSDFIDPETREALQRHREAVEHLRRGEAIDDDRFVRNRSFRLGLTEEVATTVAMREAIAPRKVQAVLERAPLRDEVPEAGE